MSYIASHKLAEITCNVSDMCWLYGMAQSLNVFGVKSKEFSIQNIQHTLDFTSLTQKQWISLTYEKCIIFKGQEIWLDQTASVVVLFYSCQL